MSLASRKLIQVQPSAAEAASDDDFASVVLLLDGDGTSGDDNNTFTDSSTNGFTVTESGSVVQGSFSPYGDNWSVYFENDTAFMQADTGIAVGTSDFTIEMWVWVTENDIRFCSQNNTGGTNFYFGTNATGNLRWDVPTGTDINSTVASGGVMDYVLPLNQWVHVAAVREGTAANQFKMYADGVLVAQDQDNSDHGGSGRKINIAGGRGNSANYDGYISNFRFVVGSAVYTSAFTPPTSPLTNITNTKLLACQSNRFIDNSSTNDTFTLNLDTGLPKITLFSPFKDDDARDITTDGGSGYFGGSDYLIKTSGVPTIGTGDFTVECWFYSNDISAGFRCLYDGREASPYSDGVGIFQNGNSIEVWTSSKLIDQNVITPNEWTHLALVRNSGSIQLYINGSASGSAVSFTTNCTSDERIIGENTVGSGYYFQGYISDLRETHSAVYTSAFTPPTAPLTAITNTELLLNFQDSGIYDRSGINNLDTVGNAQIDTAVKKYGSGSIEFDGSGDYLLSKSDSSLYAFGSGDFTIEMWIYPTSLTSTEGGTVIFYDQRPLSTDGNYPVIYMQSGQLRYFVNNSDRITGSTLSADTWYHVAICRSGTSTKMFLNGTQDGSTYSDSTSYLNGADRPVIGTRGYNLGDNDYTGFIDDLRITKGVARYTANFTPPTDALPKF